ncbi:MAG: deoxyribodipyrimidine photo-lyase [Bacteriovoracia bacterium]
MHKINYNRVRLLNKNKIKDYQFPISNSINGPVIYWMNREIRTRDNWSLIFAQNLAEKNNQPLLVVYNLIPGFLGGQNRHLTFKIGGLIDVEKDLAQKNIPFEIVVDKKGQDEEKSESANLILDYCKKHKAGALVTDFYPLNISKKWVNEISNNIEVPFFEVDSHNIVPAWVASNKKEYAAYTIRPKIHKNLKEYLDNFPKIKKQDKTLIREIETKVQKNDWNKLLPKKSIEKMDWIQPGQNQVEKVLKNFIENKLNNYALDRNDPNKDNQSNLSPYLHYGMISSQRIAQDVVDWTNQSIEKIIDEKKNKAKVDSDAEPTKIINAGAFLEELIVRKELSDNFCLYEENYDNHNGFPDWAKKTLRRSEKDKREYVYTKTEFEEAKTHDDLWNAAQLEMVKKGKMHGYLRMYWAKKILEWTNTSQYAQEVAIYLNDKYELDGRDPNGYSGIAWSIGGVHDRPWFDRQIFGQIRYMARSGCEKKFDTKTYIEKWIN